MIEATVTTLLSAYLTTSAFNVLQTFKKVINVKIVLFFIIYNLKKCLAILNTNEPWLLFIDLLWYVITFNGKPSSEHNTPILVPKTHYFPLINVLQE